MDELVKAVLAFRDQRDWRQFHNPKDLALLQEMTQEVCGTHPVSFNLHHRF